MARNTWERWDVPAAKSLLRYITQNGPRLSKQWPGRTQEIVRILRKHSEAWARDMREADRNKEKPTDNGEAWWLQNMTNAEAEITQQLGEGA